MRKVRIFLGSPSDVAEERATTKRAVEFLASRYAERIGIEIIAWEDFHFPYATSMQEHIDERLLHELQEKNIVAALFIFWTTRGSPVRPVDGAVSEHTGTTHEFNLLRKASATNSGRPALYVFRRSTDEAAWQKYPTRKYSASELKALIEEQEALDRFFATEFSDESGRNAHGYIKYRNVGQFATEVQALLRRILDAEASLSTEGWNGVEPYKGLGTYQTSDNRLFFGRSDEVADLLRLLTSTATTPTGFLLIVGPSGAGKSSLIRAGVIPQLEMLAPEDAPVRWHSATCQPSGSRHGPVFALLDALAHTLDIPAWHEMSRALDAAAWKATEVAVPTSAQEVLTRVVSALHQDAHAEPTQTRLFLLVDQFEELYAANVEEAQRSLFLAILHGLVDSGRACVVTTLRSDLYAAPHDDQQFLALKARGHQYDLSFPQPTDLRNIVVNPARHCGLTFEVIDGRGLQERLVEDARTHLAALPLLGYALHELFLRREGDCMTYRAYNEFGGVGGAIAYKANECFGALDAEAQAQVPSIFRALCWVNSTGLVTSRVASAAEVFRSDAARRAIRVFTEARLLVSDGIAAQPTLRVAHEAVFDSWKRLKDWVRQEHRALELRSELDRLRTAGGSSIQEKKGFVAYADFIRKADPLMDANWLDDAELGFLLRVSLASSSRMKDWSRCLKQRAPQTWRTVMEEALDHPDADIAASACASLHIDRDPELLRRIIERAEQQREPRFLQAAAKIIASWESSENFELLAGNTFSLGRIALLGHSAAVASSQAQPLPVEAFIAAQPAHLRRQIAQQHWLVRARQHGLSLLFALMPAMLFATVGAVAVKAIGGVFGLSICQGEPSWVMGAFHGATAGIMWSGGILFTVLLIHLTLAKRQPRESAWYPLSTVVMGPVAGFVVGLAISAVVLGVYQTASLIEIGWLRTGTAAQCVLDNGTCTLARVTGIQRFSEAFLRQAFFETRLGWVYPITGALLGLAMANVVNRIFSGPARHEMQLELDNADTIDSTAAFWRIGKQVWRHWPYLAFWPTLAAFLASAVPPVYSAANAGSFYINTNKYPNWLMLFVNVFIDNMSQFAGAYLAISGSLIGFLIVRYGVRQFR